jgi:hypothetical protein
MVTRGRLANGFGFFQRIDRRRWRKNQKSPRICVGFWATPLTLFDFAEPSAVGKQQKPNRYPPKHMTNTAKSE